MRSAHVRHEGITADVPPLTALKISVNPDYGNHPREHQVLVSAMIISEPAGREVRETQVTILLLKNIIFPGSAIERL
jgi:hypothetical protein